MRSRYRWIGRPIISTSSLGEAQHEMPTHKLNVQCNCIYSLSRKGTCMADLAVEDEAGGKVDEAEIVGRLLVPADEQAAEAVEPAVGDLDDPAPGRVAVGVAGWWQGLRIRRLGRDVRGIATADGDLTAGGVVIAPIQAQVPCRGWWSRRHRDRHGVKQGVQLLPCRADWPR